MSPQKHAAQIANAQRSHGAVTEAGRLRSSANSTRHGLASRKLRIIPPEDREEFAQHCSEMLPALAPEGAIENHLADLIVFDEWRRIRIRGLENEIFAMGFTTAKDQFFAGAETWLAKSKELAMLTLYEQRIARVLSHNKAELEARQFSRKTSGADLLVCAESRLPEAASIQPPESEPETSAPAASVPTETADPAPDGGFVRSSAASAQAATPKSPVPAATQSAPDGGFVRSSAASAPAAAAPQLLTPVEKRLENTGGFVHSSNTPPTTSDPQLLPPGRDAARPLTPAVRVSA